jgi:hypothetical protein
MSMGLIRQRPKSLRKSEIVRALGLEPNVRWEFAAVLVKARIVAARRRHDDVEAAF